MAARDAAEASEKRQEAVRAGKVPELAKAEDRRPPPLRLPGILGRLPWDLAQDKIGAQVTDWIGLVAGVVQSDPDRSFAGSTIRPSRPVLENTVE